LWSLSKNERVEASEPFKVISLRKTSFLTTSDRQETDKKPPDTAGNTNEAENPSEKTAENRRKAENPENHRKSPKTAEKLKITENHRKSPKTAEKHQKLSKDFENSGKTTAGSSCGTTQDQNYSVFWFFVNKYDTKAHNYRSNSFL
jgi:hypothetical protein